MNYNWNWGIFFQTSPDGVHTYVATLLLGTGWTLATALAAWCLALSLGSLVGAGILSLARGQRMAALALGLSQPQSYAYVLLPMAYRIILPPLTSEFLNCIKNSSVALTIGLMELTARARAMQEMSFQVFEAFTAATIIYIVINIIVTFAMRYVEQRVAVPGLIGAKPAVSTH